MGWLEDQGRERGYKSLRALAVALAEEDTSTPESERAKPEHLANMVRKLDRREGVEWWQHTGKVHLVNLQRLLGLSEEALLDSALPAPDAAAGPAARVWPFTMFDALRPLDLDAEPPFPGVPVELRQRGGPATRCTWWVAAAGAGKTLVGRYLEAQHGWTYLRAHTWSDVKERLVEDGGRLYVELDSGVGASAKPDEDVPSSMCVCVASTDEPPSQDDGSTSEGTVVNEPPQPRCATPSWPPLETPPPAEWLRDLVDWVVARVRRKNAVDAAQLRELVSSPTAAHPWSTPGEALALFGVVQKYGIDGDRPLKWVQSWIDDAAARSDRDVPRGMEAHLETGATVLVETVKRRLRQGEGVTQSREAWSALVPPPAGGPTDYAKILEITARREPDAAEQIERLLRPNGAAWVDAFTGIRLLRDAGRGLAVQPGWLAATVELCAFEELYAEVPGGRGALLLHAPTARRALDRLREDLEDARDTVIEEALAGTDEGTPEAFALLDGVVRACGFVSERLPSALARQLWDRARALSVARWSTLPPLPLVGVAVVDRWRGATSMGAWYLAMLALSRRADAGAGPATALDPWRGDLGDEEAARLLEAMTHVGIAARGEPGEPGDPALAALGEAVAGALLDTVGLLRHHGRLLDLQHAAIVVALARGATLDLEDTERNDVLLLRCGLPGLERACEAAGASMTEVLRWCWTTWAEGTRAWPPFAWLRDARPGGGASDAVRVLWSAFPPELFNEHAYIALNDRRELMRVQRRPPWEAWLSAWAADPARSSRGATMFAEVPLSLVERVVVDGTVNAFCHEVRRVLWQRSPERLVSLVDELALLAPRTTYGIEGHGGPIMDLVYAAPDARVEDLVARAAVWLAKPELYVGAGPWVRVWLCKVIAERQPGWRRAFELATREAPAA